MVLPYEELVSPLQGKINELDNILLRTKAGTARSNFPKQEVLTFINDSADIFAILNTECDEIPTTTVLLTVANACRNREGIEAFRYLLRALVSTITRYGELVNRLITENSQLQTQIESFKSKYVGADAVSSVDPVVVEESLKTEYESLLQQVLQSDSNVTHLIEKMNNIEYQRAERAINIFRDTHAEEIEPNLYAVVNDGEIYVGSKSDVIKKSAEWQHEKFVNGSNPYFNGFVMALNSENDESDTLLTEALNATSHSWFLPQPIIGPGDIRPRLHLKIMGYVRKDLERILFPCPFDLRVVVDTGGNGIFFLRPVDLDEFKHQMAGGLTGSNHLFINRSVICCPWLLVQFRPGENSVETDPILRANISSSVLGIQGFSNVGDVFAFDCVNASFGFGAAATAPGSASSTGV